MTKTDIKIEIINNPKFGNKIYVNGIFAYFSTQDREIETDHIQKLMNIIYNTTETKASQPS